MPGPDKQIYYMENPAIPQSDGNMNGKLPTASTWRREGQCDPRRLNGYCPFGDKGKILYNLNDNWFLTKTGDKIEGGKGALNLDAVQLRIDPVAEWKQMFNDSGASTAIIFTIGHAGSRLENASGKKYEQFLIPFLP